jgi:hypothetical protein
MCLLIEFPPTSATTLGVSKAPWHVHFLKTELPLFFIITTLFSSNSLSQFLKSSTAAHCIYAFKYKILHHFTPEKTSIFFHTKCPCRNFLRLELQFLEGLVQLLDVKKL